MHTHVVAEADLGCLAVVILARLRDSQDLADKRAVSFHALLVPDVRRQLLAVEAEHADKVSQSQGRKNPPHRVQSLDAVVHAGDLALAVFEERQLEARDGQKRLAAKGT